MKKTVVINIVGLHERLIGEHTPFLNKWISQKEKASIEPVVPAVTCSAQATYITGKLPSEHGIVGNGWFFKDTQEVRFWHQSHHLVQSEAIWKQAKKENPAFTCSYMFWWYNMYADVDFCVTPRPQYLADGRKMPDCYSFPSNLRDELQERFGTFPLFDFWGPRTSIKSSQWIADASIYVDEKHNPTLTFIYLPHLDYNLQRFGQDFDKISSDLNQIDKVFEQLATYYQEKNTEIILLSEYGITNVNQPISLNRIFRKKNWLAIRKERGLEYLDAGASKVFAVADHQIAHIYIKDEYLIDEVKLALGEIEGVEKVYDKNSKSEIGLDHERSGDLVVLANKNAWFTYYYWLDDKYAPDFARIVDIHKKPGYDPVEMIANPKLNFLTLRVIWKLIKKKLGFRMLMDIIPLDPTLIRGSHGRIPEDVKDWPLLISSYKMNQKIKPTDVKDIIWKSVFGS